MFLGGHSLAQKTATTALPCRTWKKSLWREHFPHLPGSRDYFLYHLYSYYCRRKAIFWWVYILAEPPAPSAFHWDSASMNTLRQIQLREAAVSTPSLLYRTRFQTDVNNKKGRKIIIFSWVSSRFHPPASSKQTFSEERGKKGAVI